MSLARNQTIVLSVLANDRAKLAQAAENDWIGRTPLSLEAECSAWIGKSSCYAALDALIKQGLVSECYKAGRHINGRVGRPVHLVSITDAGNDAFHEEHGRIVALKS